MRCQQCQFENIPGESRCLRCGAVLQATAAAGALYPPRMARWKRPIRATARWFRRHSALPKAITGLKVPAFMRIMSKNAFLGLILSIIPGLAHLVSGRFREVRWFVLGWFLALLAGIFFYGGNRGLTLLGVAVGLHGWIAFSHALSKEQDEPREKIGTFVMLLVVFGLFYWGVRAFVFEDFVFGLTDLAIPYQKVQAGDTLLARQSRARANELARGSVVIGQFPRIYNYKVVANQRYETIGQIVALPGEKMGIVEGRFVVDGRVLDEAKFPVPHWMSGIRWRLAYAVPADSYFVSTNYKVNAYGMDLTVGLISDACVLKKDDISALAVMRWFPLGRRGFLRAGE